MMTLTLEGGREIPITHPGGGFRPFKGDRLVKVHLYGELAKAAGREVWELAISSAREALNALHHLTRGATTKYIAEHNKTVRWRVLVNDHQIDGSSPGVIDELCIERDVESIDIYPVMEGAGSFLGVIEAIVGVVLIVAAIVLAFYFPPASVFAFGITYGSLEAGLVLAGISAILGGILSLVNTPGKIKTPKTQGQASYLFSGPVNTQDQGGPVPVCYGNVIIGSQTISAYVEANALYQLLGSNIIYQLPPPWGNQPGQPAPILRDEVSGRVMSQAMTEYWQALGPDGFWGYATGVTIIPTNPDVATLQEPTGVYLYGPVWLIRMDNGSLGASYDPGGNFGPWQSINNCPAELDPIVVTMSTDTYTGWQPTPNLA